MVKCADCGFLGVRNLHTRDIVEAELTLREEGKIAGGGAELPDTPSA